MARRRRSAVEVPGVREALTGRWRVKLRQEERKQRILSETGDGGHFRNPLPARLALLEEGGPVTVYGWEVADLAGDVVAGRMSAPFTLQPDGSVTPGAAR